MPKLIWFFCFLLGLTVPGFECKQVNYNCSERKIVINANQTAHINCQPGKEVEDLDVQIILDGSSKEGLTLEIHTAETKDATKFEISALVSNETKPIYDDTPIGHIWLPTGADEIHIRAKKQPSGSISIKLRPECGTSFANGVSPSFVLPTSFYSGVMRQNVTCSFRSDSPGVLTFTEFELTNGSSVNFSPSSKLSGPFYKKPDHVVVVKKETQYVLVLNITNPNQTVAFSWMPLKNEICNTNNMVSVEKKITFSLTASSSTPSVLCFWLFAAAQENMRLALTLNTNKFENAQDSIVVIDSGNLSGNALQQLTSLHQESVPLLSSGRYLAVLLNYLAFGANDAIRFDVDTFSYGGVLSDKGNMIIAGDCNYTLLANEANMLIVKFDNLKLNESQTVEIYADSATVPFVRYDSKNLLTDLASPGSKLLIVAKGFKDQKISVAFDSVSKDHGCIRTFVAPQADNVRLIGTCEGWCSWLVKPNVPASQNLTYLNILPNNVQGATINNFKGKGSIINLENTADPLSLTYKTSDGFLIEFKCSVTPNFEMSYTTEYSDRVLAAQVTPAANFTLTSPFFPAIYPQMTQFEYKITPASDAVSYLASFSLFDLLPKHSLTFGGKKTTFEFTGSSLPDDFLISSGDFASTILDAKLIDSKMNPKGAAGFRVDFTATSSSNTITDPSKTFTTGSKCHELRCVYIIRLTLAADVNTGKAVNLTVTLPSNSSLSSSDLLVWDGASVLRSPLLAPVANLTKGGFFSSLSHQLIIVYRGAVDVSLKYVESTCSADDQTMCIKDRLCMPASWRCDGTIQCSDGSDELGCHGGVHPKPQPAPPSSSGWKIAFWLLMPVFILIGLALAKGVPIVVEKLRNSRYQQFHDLGDH